MKYSFLFAFIFLTAVTINAQENKSVQTPPIRTKDNVKTQSENLVQNLPIRTSDNAKQQTINTVQTVPLKTTDQAQQSKTVQAAHPIPVKKSDSPGTSQSSSAEISSLQDKVSAPTKSKLPSSISASQAQEQLQKKEGTNPSSAH
jgi:hypothetical protein